MKLYPQRDNQVSLQNSMKRANFIEFPASILSIAKIFNAKASVYSHLIDCTSKYAISHVC